MRYRLIEKLNHKSNHIFSHQLERVSISLSTGLSQMSQFLCNYLYTQRIENNISIVFHNRFCQSFISIDLFDSRNFRLKLMFV